MAIKGLDVKKSNEWNLNEFRQYFTTSKRLFGNSEEFNKIGRLTEELYEYENKEISPEMAEARTKKLQELMSAAQDYITKRANPRTSTGKERLKIANDLMSFCKVDIEYTTFGPSIEYFSGKKMEDARKGVSYDDIKKLDNEKEKVAESYVMSEEAVKDYKNKTKKASLATKICMKFNKLLSRQDKEELNVLGADYENELSALNDPNVVKGMRYLYSKELKQLNEKKFFEPARDMIQGENKISREQVSRTRSGGIDAARERGWRFADSKRVEEARKASISEIVIDEMLMEKASNSVKGFNEILEQKAKVEKITHDALRKQAEAQKIKDGEAEYAKYQAEWLKKEEAHRQAEKILQEKEKAYNEIKDAPVFPSDKENAKKAYEKAQADLKEMEYQRKKAREDLQAAGLRTGHDKREEVRKREEREREKAAKKTPEKKALSAGKIKTAVAGKK